MLTIGSLCSGYGGLNAGVQLVLDADVAWHSDIDPGACKILAHHWSDVPNLGDMTTVDWSQVEPVDIITGGTPCQDLSHAGKRAGMRAGTRSGLWASMCDAIQIIRPSLVVWENVRGALSADADSAMEPCPGCVGDGDDGPVLRALGRVLGDLADLGFDARWYGLRATDVGAPHGRFRIFVVATHTDDGGWRHAASDSGTAGTGVRAEPDGRGSRGAATDADSGIAGSFAGGTARAVDARRQRQQRPELGRPAVASATDAADLGHQRAGESRDGRARSADSGSVAANADSAGSETCGGRPGAGNPRRRESLVDRGADRIAWGQYEPAIRRWATVLGRCAPAPTEPGRTGNPRLSPRFVEWLMGLPDGHVTDVPGLSRNEQLKALGNGVVPHQAAAALRMLLNAEEVAADSCTEADTATAWARWCREHTGGIE